MGGDTSTYPRRKKNPQLTPEVGPDICEVTDGSLSLLRELREGIGASEGRGAKSPGTGESLPRGSGFH